MCYDNPGPSELFINGSPVSRYEWVMKEFVQGIVTQLPNKKDKRQKIILF